MCVHVCVCRQELLQHSTDLESLPNIRRRIRLFLAIVICDIHVCVRHFVDSGRIVLVIAGPKYVDFVAYLQLLLFCLFVLIGRLERVNMGTSITECA